MITFLNAKAEDKTPAIANEALTQGQYCTVAGISGDDFLMDAVDAAGDAQDTRDKLYLVMKDTIVLDGDDDTDHDTIASGAHLIRIGHAPGLQVEDSMLTTNSAAAVWSGATVGDLVILNTSGYLTLVGASDDPTSATPIGKFIKLVNDIVSYEMV